MPSTYEARTGEPIDTVFKQYVEALSQPTGDSEEYERYGSYVGQYPSPSALPISAGTPISKVVVSVERVLDAPIPDAGPVSEDEVLDPDAAAHVEEIDSGGRRWTIAWKDADGEEVLCITRTGRDRFSIIDSDSGYDEQAVRGTDMAEGLHAILGELMGAVNTGDLQPLSDEELEAEMFALLDPEEGFAPDEQLVVAW